MSLTLRPASAADLVAAVRLLAKLGYRAHGP